METNKVLALRKKEKTPGVPNKVQEAIDAGDHEACFQALTPLQQNFCLEYLKDLNASKACVRAGYNVSSNANRVGPELLTKPGVQFALEGLMADRREKQHVDANYVINKIIKSLERSETKENEAAVLRAAELLGKHLGVFIERQEISGPDGAAIELERRTKQEAEEFTKSLLRNKNTNKIIPPENDSE